MKKILILYAKYGGGHLAAANSISKYIENNYEDTEVRTLDFVEYFNKFINNVTTGAYKKMAKNAPRFMEKVLLWFYKRLSIRSQQFCKYFNG